MTTLTKLEIIEETYRFYNADTSKRAAKPRQGSDSRTVCEYLNSDGNKCAFGRVMTDEAIEQFGNHGGPVSDLIDERFDDEHEDMICTNDLDSERQYYIDQIVKPQYQGHSVEFWSDLQTFHDTDLFWDEDGLTIHGHTHLQELKTRWKGV